MTKKILITLAVLIGLTIYAWLEYTWADKVIANHDDTWTVISKQTDWTLIKPWTWFKNPIVTVMLLEDSAYGKLDSQYYFAHTVTFRMGEDDFERIDIVDIQNQKFASCTSLEEFRALDEEKLPKLFWVKFMKTSVIYDLSEFLKNNVRSYVTIDLLGAERDITNYITSGHYNIRELDNKGHVWTLINNKPYLITDADLILIQESLAKWYNDHPDFSSKNITVYPNQVNYSYSQMFYTMTDVFSFNPKAKNNGRDTILNIELTFSKLYYPVSKSENEAVFFHNE